MRILWLLLLSACAPKALRFPGPLGPVGRDVAPRTADPAGPAPAAEEEPWFEAPAMSSRANVRLSTALVDAAEHYLDHGLDGFRDDCSGYACAVYSKAGLPLSGSVRTLYDLARENGWVHKRKVPRPGDLVFFDDTYDRDRDGRTNDPLTHVAVVLEVGRDGTVVMGHGGTSRGRTTLTMNLSSPSVHEDADGRLLNDYLRRKRSSDPGNTRYLAGELWVAFATPDPRDLAGMRVTSR